jgi:hypothetical protein
MAKEAAVGPHVIPLVPDGGVEAAIANVLSAEREAQAAIEASRRDADALAAATRLKVRQIADRAEARILAARRSVERRIAEHEARVKAEVAALLPDENLTPDDLARLDAAVQALARELTGGAP